MPTQTKIPPAPPIPWFFYLSQAVDIFFIAFFILSIALLLSAVSVGYYPYWRTMVGVLALAYLPLAGVLYVIRRNQPYGSLGPLFMVLMTPTVALFYLGVWLYPRTPTAVMYAACVYTVVYTAYVAWDQSQVRHVRNKLDAVNPPPLTRP